MNLKHCCCAATDLGLVGGGALGDGDVDDVDRLGAAVGGDTGDAGRALSRRGLVAVALPFTPLVNAGMPARLPAGFPTLTSSSSVADGG